MLYYSQSFIYRRNSMFSTTGTVSLIILLSVPMIACNDNPLFLSPLIDSGDSAGAQKAATVRRMLPGIESFSGYITVNKFHGSHLFFWMFQSIEGDWEKAPVIIWLQGGPGASSLFGLFQEIGPFSVNASLHLTKREYPWCKKYNLLFIDNPVGAGFSFTTEDAGYAKTEYDVAKDLHNFMLQFYRMFPKLAKNPLFLMGQSYAGKFIPSFAEYIYKCNAGNIMGNINIPLEAIAIGNGFIDPYNMMRYGDYLYQLGMIDHHGRSRIHELEEKARTLIKMDRYAEAADVWEDILNNVLKWAKLSTVYNYINDKDHAGTAPWENFVRNPVTRQALHVGNQPFDVISTPAHLHMVDDIMKSAKPAVEALLNWEAYDVVVYSGQLDIICAYPLVLNVFQKLNWRGATAYRKAERCLLEMDGNVVGYTKSAGVFTEVLFRGCGHMVPTDCPKAAYWFLDLFINDRKKLKCLKEAGEASHSGSSQSDTKLLTKTPNFDI